MHDPRALGPEERERPRDELGQLRPRHADELARRAGRVRERAQQVEGGADAEIAARHGGVAHRRMKRRREEERDPGLVQASLDDRRLGGDVHAERLEQVRAAAPARHRPVAVLRHADPARREHERGDGRDVERVGAIAARAARVEHRRVIAGQPRRAPAHRPGQPDDLRGPLAFHRERDEQAGDLRRLRAPFHDLFHGARRLVHREVLAPLQLFDQFGKHHRSSSRKLRRSCLPSPVSTDSGWNCTPWTGNVRCRTPMSVPSSVRAAASSDSGSGSATTSEW